MSSMGFIFQLLCRVLIMWEEKSIFNVINIQYSINSMYNTFKVPIMWEEKSIFNVLVIVMSGVIRATSQA